MEERSRDRAAGRQKTACLSIKEDTRVNAVSDRGET